jgi:XTP/dITP diphosphohydrolase
LEIVIATKNKGKVDEIKYFFNTLNTNLKIDFKSLLDFNDVPEVVEDGSTFEENALIKAKSIANYLNKITVADDSGLEVDVLSGKPGIYSSRYCGKDADDKSNRGKLLQELEEIKDFSKRKARFVCSLVLWDPKKGLIFKTNGVCEGNIGFNEKGEGGFGYDSLFIPKGYDKTMAELGSDEKNKISHRGKALKNLAVFLSNTLKSTC